MLAFTFQRLLRPQGARNGEIPGGLADDIPHKITCLKPTQHKRNTSLDNPPTTGSQCVW